MFDCLCWHMQIATASAEPLVVGYSAVSSVLLPFWIGKEAGFYKKEFIDSQLVYIASSTTMAQAMFARQFTILVGQQWQCGDQHAWGRSCPHRRCDERCRVLRNPAGDRKCSRVERQENWSYPVGVVLRFRYS